MDYYAIYIANDRGWLRDCPCTEDVMFGPDHPGVFLRHPSYRAPYWRGVVVAEFPSLEAAQEWADELATTGDWGESAPPEYGVEPLEERWRISGEGLIDYTLADQWGNELVSALYDPVEEEWDTDSDGCCVPDGAVLHLPDDEMIRDAAEVRAYVLKLKEEDANEY